MRTNGNQIIYSVIILSQGDCFENREGTKQKVESEASWNGELGNSMGSESARNTLLLVRSARETEMEAFAIRQQCSQEETRNHPKAQNSSQERPGNLHAPAKTRSNYREPNEKSKQKIMLMRVALGLEIGVAQSQAS
jgi:hypothetical protein